jgi:2-polyprenyl-3-methyl-5-hydroxy-6-metoxy-1,4-benzoquinol methylase
MTLDLHRKANLASWNESVSTHVASELYDVQGFREGACTLSAIERRELEQLVGRGVSLLHLQCHFGLDTLSWARRGAVVTGIDFSREAIETARSLADDVGLSERATFLESDLAMPFLEACDDGLLRVKGHHEEFPLSFSLRMTKGR